ncbi:MAG: cation:dicarboxylate symporter family transporter [Myxococcota bacterium]
MSERTEDPEHGGADDGAGAAAGGRRRFKLDLSSQVMIGLALGVGAGIFLGELAAHLQIIGDIFVRLLQMTVLPFVVLSLVAGLGRLELSQALGMAKRGGGVLLASIGVALLFVYLLPWAWPEIESASFFSTSLVEEPPAFDMLGLYIPSNPFFSLVNSLVPAIVLFSLALGVALIGVPGKEKVVAGLEPLIEALVVITGVVARTAPYGVFAIAASATGTLSLSELQRIQVYVASYAAAALLLAFWVMPGLVTTLTPISYRTLLGATRSGLITAFATGNLLIVIPMLTEACRRIVAEAVPEEGDAPSGVEVMVPTSFNFPSTGKILSLLFLPFAAWFGGGGFGLSQWATVAFAGTTSFFGQNVIAVPFMLDLLRLPSDLFQLFLAVDVFAGRFQVMLAAMFTVVVSLIGAIGVPGGLRSRLPRLLRFGAVSVGLMVGLVAVLRLVFALIDIDYQGYQRFIALELHYPPVEHRVLRDESPEPVEPAPGRRLAEILERGELRACYFRDALPLAFQNEEGHLVGYDIEMMYGLARDLDVSILFHRIERGSAATLLDNGTCDIIASGVVLTTRRARDVTLSSPYLQVAVAFVVSDHRRDEFATWEGLRERRDLTIGIGDVPHYERRIQRRLPHAKLVQVETAREFFAGKRPDLDALVQGAETGSAWTLVYPQFNVVVPKPGRILVPAAYAMPRGEAELADIVDTWIALTADDGTAEALYRHWILGEDAEAGEKRWSVVRNVLGWVD